MNSIVDRVVEELINIRNKWPNHFESNTRMLYAKVCEDGSCLLRKSERTVPLPIELTLSKETALALGQWLVLNYHPIAAPEDKKEEPTA